ncbi:hypothetical protein IL306_004870 [Fusarium sp. DS 682]|nr:hypothetical protein IL306_004870 [Fusarium sp. DS 682]
MAYGRERNPPRSLLLDTVMQGRPRASSCKLLQLPAEVLADIVDLLRDDKPSLASLALVNSDCQQLARCCQFAEVHFDYTIPSQCLIITLATNILKRFERPTINACIRRVIFASPPQNVAGFHRALFGSTFGDNAASVTQDEREALRKEASSHYQLMQNNSVMAISSMPNLETVIWRDRYALDAVFFPCITRSKARHVVLNKAAIDEPWTLTPALVPYTWPITSLNLNIDLGVRDRGRLYEESTVHPLTNFFSTLFQMCSPTLESLFWDFFDIRDKEKFPVSIGQTGISFPRLKHLQLAQLKLDSVGISSFLAAPLKTLELSENQLADAETLPCGPYQYLESFATPRLPQEALACERIANFIAQHNRIHRLYLHEADTAPGDKAHLDSRIIPVLNGPDFSSLRSLSLAWGGGSLAGTRKLDIPTASLEVIGRITSLEQLCLSAGFRFGWRHQWIVNHDKLRRHLGQLKELKKLALFRDTYSPSIPADADRYYTYRFAGPKEEQDAEARPDLDKDQDTESEYGEDENELEPLSVTWERAHRNRMLDQAEKYVKILPQLEWVLFGQRPMGFKKTLEGKTQIVRAVPLTKGRDECRTYLEIVFRGMSPDWV